MDELKNKIKVQSLDPLTFPLFGKRLIEASAGTGKTYTIASLFIRLLLGHGKDNGYIFPLTVDKILVVTFTEAATAELRSRIRERIVSVRLAFLAGHSEDPFSQRLISDSNSVQADIRLLRFAELQIDEAAIYTIHGFCQRMLKQNAFESGSLFQHNLLEDDTQFLLQAVNDFWRTFFYDLSAPLTELIFSYWQNPQALKKELLSYLSHSDMQFLPEICDFDFKYKYKNSLAIIKNLKNNWIKSESDYFDIITHSNISKRSYSKKNLPNWLDQISCWAFVVDSSLNMPKNLSKFSQKVLYEKTPKGATPKHAVFSEIEKILELDLSLKNTVLIKAIHWVRAHLQKNKQAQTLLGFDDLLSNLNNALQKSENNHLAAQIRLTYPIALIDEFQDTDPVQYSLFNLIYQTDKGDPKLGNEKSSGLFMIGDPKQAIYSFRGADIFTYMKARQSVTAHYSLDYNYRSSPEMIHAVNAFFDFCPAPFVYENDIPFIKVKAPEIKRKKLIIANTDDFAQTALQFIHPVGGENAEGFKDTITHACVNEIKTILQLSQQGKAYLEDESGNKTAISANNIAVLVRTGKEASLIRKTLFNENINSVYLSLKESVYSTPLAQDLLYILKACLYPENERLLRSAVACKLFALTPYQIHQLLADTQLWELKIVAFTDYKAVWQKNGVLVMLHKLIHEQEISRSLLTENKGERLLTDLLHLSELLQKNSVEQEGEFALLRWFSEQLRQASEGNDQKQRLESEKDLLQVSTLHKSKGLEYDIVFMPFVGLYRKVHDCIYHDSNNSFQLCYDLNNNKNSLVLAEKEQLAEDLRLLYVGLTRSVYRCYIGISSYKSGRLKNSPLAKSALGYICLKTGKDLLAGNTALLNDHLNQMCQTSNNISVRVRPADNETIYQEKLTDNVLYPPALFNRDIERNWWINSYSSLSRFHSHSAEVSTKNIESAVEETVVIKPEKTPFNFPKGAKHGTFLHELFELIDFETADNKNLSVLVLTQLEKHLYDSAELWAPILATWIEQILAHSLFAEKKFPEKNIKLSDLSVQAKKVEMQFFLSMKPVNSFAVNKLIKLHDPLSARAGELHFRTVQGFLKGFIDLTFEQEGKYYILDYKSNYLGDKLTDYSLANIELAMIEHRYDFQYQLYTLALHRLLKSRLPDYHYETHIGGVFYTFLRGMQGQKGFGIYYNKPNFALIDGLDKIFSGENEPC